MFKAIHHCWLMYLRTLEIWVLKYISYPEKFLLAPELAHQATLKKTKVNLDLLNDIDMLVMVEKDVRGGIRPSIS